MRLDAVEKQMFEGLEIQVLTATLATVGVFLFLRWIKQKGNGKRYPPSLPLLPLLAAAIRGGISVLPEHLRRSSEELGPVVSFKIGKSLAVVLNGYETIVNAFVKQSEVFADKMPLFTETEILNPELRGIVFARYGDAFRKNKKLSLSILKEFGLGQTRVTETRILHEVEKMNEEILKHNGRPFDPKWPLTFASSDVILSIMFGTSFQTNLPEVHSTIVKSSIECIANMDLTLNFAPFVRFLPTFRSKVVKMRITIGSVLKAFEEGIEFTKSTNSEPTFVGRYLEIEGTEYDHQDLLYVLRDICFAGIETVSTTLEWATVELANHPEIQSRFQREIDEMVPGDRLPSLDDKPRLPYSEAVMLEVMRRHTVVPLLVPHATMRDTKLHEYDIPNGTMVIGNAYSAHMDEKFWKDPEKFRPERFLDEDNNIINGDRMISFSLGKRSCLGEIIGRQNTFLFMTSLVQRFDIRPPEGQDSIQVEEVTAVTTCPEHFEVRLIPRAKTTKSLG